MTLCQMSDARNAIKDALDGIKNLHNHKQEPDVVPSFPFTILGNASIDYNTDFGGGMSMNFRLFLAVAGRDAKNGFASLDKYLSTDEDESIKDAVDGATVGNGYAMVARVENVGHVVYREITLIGAEFIITVQSGG